MKTCSKSSLILVKLIYITFLPVLEAQKVIFQPKVTGYLGHDVTLPCQFKGPQDTNITQIQWDLLTQEGTKSPIIVYSSKYGTDIPNTSPLKVRVEFAVQSLTIKDVELSDAGSYICTFTTFPSGAFEGKTTLIVQEQVPLSSGLVAAIAITVILLVGIMVATVYFFFIRHHSSLRGCVFNETGVTVMDATRPSVNGKDEDVVYAYVKLKQSRDVTPSSNERSTKTMLEDVTYADVVILDQKPKWDHKKNTCPPSRV